MDAVLHLPVLILCMAVGLGTSAIIPGKGLYFESYHLCNRTETKTVTKVVAYQKPYETNSPCGWIPWRLCAQTYYRTEYRSIDVPETMNVKDCCEGYEQLGDYCVLSFDRSSEFTSRPGICPAKPMNITRTACTYDLDCPGLQKCCRSSNGSVCSSPMPEALLSNMTKSWYNATVHVKMAFADLRKLDPQFVNHTRLLHSMITGALWPFNNSVHHISTVQAEIFTTESHLLIGLYELVPLKDISEKLQDIVRRIPEVINIKLQDVNECVHDELSDCSEDEFCTNVEGYYNCSGAHEPPGLNTSGPGGGYEGVTTSPPSSTRAPMTGHPGPFHDRSSDSSASDLDTGCYCTAISNLNVFNVTGNSFQMSWRINSSLHHVFHVELHNMSGTIQTKNTTDMKIEISGLEAGKLYNVSVSYHDCDGNSHISTEQVKTGVMVVTVFLRITNYNFKHEYTNTSSSEYKELKGQLEEELTASLSHTIPRESLRVEVTSLRNGSIIAEFIVFITNTKFTVNISRMSESLSYLNNSTRFKIDLDSSSVQETGVPITSTTLQTTRGPLRTSSVSGPPSFELTTTDLTWMKNKSIVMDFYPIQNATAERMGSENTSAQAHVNASESWHVPLPTYYPPTDILTKPVGYLNTSTSPGIPEIANHTDCTLSKNTTQMDYPLAASPRSQSSLLTQDTENNTTSPTVAQENRNATSGDFSKPTASSNNFTESRTPWTTAGSYMNSTWLAMLHPPTNLTSASSPVVSNSSLSSSGNRTAQNSTAVMPPSSPQPLKEAANTTSITLTATKSESNTTSLPMMDYPIKSPSTTTPFDSTTTTRHTPTDSLVPSLVKSTTTTTAPVTSTMKETTTIASRMERIPLKGNSRVECNSANIVLTINKTFLNSALIQESSLTFGQPSCNMSITSNSLQVRLDVVWTENCTKALSNNTHLVVSAMLQASEAGQPKLMVNVTCTYNRNFEMSSGSGVIQQGDIQIVDVIEGDGSFQPEFQLYSGKDQIGKNGTLNPDEDVRIVIAINRQDQTYKVVLVDCWVSSSSNSSDPDRHLFIKDSCSVEGTKTSVNINGEDWKAEFTTRVFANIEIPVIYLHCKLHICRATLTQTCKPVCSGARSVRNTDAYDPKYARIGPLNLTPRLSARPAVSGTMAPGYVVLIFLATVAVISGVATVLIYRYYRRTGRYDFKPKCARTGYSVFSN